MFCSNGFETDANGCDVCKCAADEPDVSAQDDNDDDSDDTDDDGQS